MTVEPGVPSFVTWSTQLVMLAQPALGECRRKYKLVSCAYYRISGGQKCQKHYVNPHEPFALDKIWKEKNLSH